MALERERATYDRKREELLQHDGWFVVIHGDDVVGVWDTYRYALKEAYSRFGLDDFMVKKIAPPGQVHVVVTRVVEAPCT